MLRQDSPPDHLRLKRHQSGGVPQGDVKELSYGAKSLDVSTWREPSRALKPDATTAEGRRRIHIDENTTVLLQSNEEKSLSDFMAEFRSSAIKLELVMINSLAKGWASEALYSKVESMADAIFDFRAEVTDERMHHVMRTRMVRGMSRDTRWKDLKLRADGAVSVSSQSPRSEPGISGWLKGPAGRKTTAKTQLWGAQTSGDRPQEGVTTQAARGSLATWRAHHADISRDPVIREGQP